MSLPLGPYWSLIDRGFVKEIDQFLHKTGEKELKSGCEHEKRFLGVKNFLGG